MMQALLGKTAAIPKQKDLKEAAVQLMPDFDETGTRRILLNFPLALDSAHIQGHLKKAELWNKQFQSWKNGDQLPFLRWPSEFDGKESHHWWEETKSFRVLAADLGTHHAASVALIEATQVKHPDSRFIGETSNQSWFARFLTGKVLRLPGEDVQVFRKASPLDGDKQGTTFREELYGAKGRMSSETECRHTIELLNALDQSSLLFDANSTETLKRQFSFPEQNDKILVALRRTQNWIATCVSWHWKLTQPDSDAQREVAISQIAEQDRKPEWKALATTRGESIGLLRDLLRDHITHQRQLVMTRLLETTQRILPLKGRTWTWQVHPEKPDCHLLSCTTKSNTSAKTLLTGQRGLSIARIEQLSELRRRWQSLNQALRRELGQRPLSAAEMRNDPIPDPCPDILRKLENLREQRVNQTAHLIIAQALGLKLKMPELSQDVRRKVDMHGEYEVGRIPADMIVLEDLSRYLSDQGRAKSENTRLMKWCHRAITEKVKLLAEPFGIPVLETPAAYSSRFCSLTGMAGFRATEVSWKDRHKFRWKALLKEEEESRAKAKVPSAMAQYAAGLFKDLRKIAESPMPTRTLLAPQTGGPIFVTAKPVAHPAPAKTRRSGTGAAVLPMQADINAAINLALRAIAHPACADLHHRLRTERKVAAKTKQEIYSTREIRRFSTEPATVEVKQGHSLPKERNSNLFFDPYNVAAFGRSRLSCDKANEYPYAAGPGLWKVVNNPEFQWCRCLEINRQRLTENEDIPW